MPNLAAAQTASAKRRYVAKLRPPKINIRILHVWIALYRRVISPCVKALSASACCLYRAVVRFLGDFAMGPPWAYATIRPHGSTRFSADLISRPSIDTRDLCESAGAAARSFMEGLASTTFTGAGNDIDCLNTRSSRLRTCTCYKRSAHLDACTSHPECQAERLPIFHKSWNKIFHYVYLIKCRPRLIAYGTWVARLLPD